MRRALRRHLSEAHVLGDRLVRDRAIRSSRDGREMKYGRTAALIDGHADRRAPSHAFERELLRHHEVSSHEPAIDGKRDAGNS